MNAILAQKTVVRPLFSLREEFTVLCSCGYHIDTEPDSFFTRLSRMRSELDNESSDDMVLSVLNLQVPMSGQVA